MKRGLAFGLLLLLALLSACGGGAPTPEEQALALDVSYGARGVAIAPAAGDPGGGDAPYTLSVSDGEAFVAGRGCRNPAPSCSSENDWLAAAWRFDASGRPDANFASSGVFVSADPAGGTMLSVIFDAVAAAGGYRLAGVAVNAAGDLDAVLWALRSGGSPDPAFYGGAPALVSDWAAAGAHDLASAMLAGPGHTWLAGGVRAGTYYDVAVWKVKDDGSPDTAFDGDGVWTFNTATGNDWAQAIARDGEGRLWLAGATTGTGGSLPAVWQVDPAGGLVAGFGQNGWVELPLLGGDQGVALKLAPDGEGAVVLGCLSGAFTTAAGAGPLGLAQVAGGRLALWRLGADGALDTGFGDGGALLLPGETVCDTFRNPVALAVDEDGNYWVAGGVTSERGDLDMAVWRVLADGSLDPHFCGGDACTFDNAAGGYGDDWGSAIALDGEDVYVAGWSWNGARRATVVWKLNIVEVTP
ncbi:hypothetical protein [Oceanithermus sp.]